jgi:hypothetical protein
MLDNIYYFYDAYRAGGIYAIAFPEYLRNLPMLVAPNNTDSTNQKIASFKNLPSGWHYGEGVAPSSAMIEVARDWLNKIAQLGFTTTNAFPGVAGEIMISGRNGDHDIEVILETDGSISFEHEKNDEVVTSIEHSSLREVERALAQATRAAGELWSTSDLFTAGTLSQIKIVLPAWHSEITAAAFPSFYLNAFEHPVARFADIYERTIPSPQGNPQYFGSWTDLPTNAKHQYLLPAR